MIVGTAGHVDHGKTTLVKALTGVDTDRLKEEKARGISVDLGFAYLPTPDGGMIGFVDVPGHEKFVHNMLAGATGIHFVCLVVAADDGVMPQTREHLAIVDLLGLARGVVALTKADRVDAVRRAEVVAEIDELLAPTAFAGAEVIAVSAVTGQGLEHLRRRLFAAARGTAGQETTRLFRLAVDRAFALPGAGTVVTGTVMSGLVATGSHVAVSPPGLRARVRAIHAQGRPAGEGRLGDRCALNLVGEGVSKDAVHRGDVVLDPDLHAPSERIDAWLRLLASEPGPVRLWTPVRLHHAATDVGARVVPIGRAEIAPGEAGLIQLVLARPIAAAAGDRFVLRDTSARRTIGGGRFLDLRAPARRRHTPERLAQLAALAIPDAMQALAALLARPPGFVDLGGFARDRALTANEMHRIAKELGLVSIAWRENDFAVGPDHWPRLREELIAVVAAHHSDHPDLPGVGREALRRQLTSVLPVPLFAGLLHALATEKQIGLDGAWVRLASHQARLTPDDELLWQKTRPLIAGGRFRPPRVRDIGEALGVPESQVRRMLKLLGRAGRVHQVAHDHFFLRETVAEMVAVAVDLASRERDGMFAAAQFRNRLDNGRKVAIQILEFFDAHGVTLRRGDLRRINRHRLDLFVSFASGIERVRSENGRESSLVGRPDFKSGGGREPVPGGFDSHSLPPEPGFMERRQR